MDLAVETSTTDPNNPRAYQDAGTPGVFAPEQIRWINSNTRSVHDTPPMKSATNVFAIGLTIYCELFLIQSFSRILADFYLLL